MSERFCQNSHLYVARDDTINPRCWCGAPPRFRPTYRELQDGGKVEVHAHGSSKAGGRHD